MKEFFYVAEIEIIKEGEKTIRKVSGILQVPVTYSSAKAFKENIEVLAEKLNCKFNDILITTFNKAD